MVLLEIWFTKIVFLCVELSVEVDDSYMGYETWSPSPPKLEKPRSVFNAASLAFIGDSIYEVRFFIALCWLVLCEMQIVLVSHGIGSCFFFFFFCSYMLVGIFFSLRLVLKITTIVLELWCAVKLRFVISWPPFVFSNQYLNMVLCYRRSRVLCLLCYMVLLSSLTYFFFI